MLPEIWGSTIWNSMHLIAAAYPEKPKKSDKCHYRLYYTQLGNVIPCPTCAESYRRFMKKHPIENFLATKRSLMYWVYLMHNRVNRKLKKKTKISWKSICMRYAKLAYLPHKVPSKYCNMKYKDKG